MSDTITLSITVPAVVTRTIAGVSCEFDFSKAPAETLAWQLIYGFRGVNDYAGSAKHIATEKGAKPEKWLPSDSRAYHDKWLDGTIARAARSGGGSVADPVGEAARQLACADILTALGVTTWPLAQATEKGAKYFVLRQPKDANKKAYVARNDDAIDEFIKKNDAKREYMKRAQAIVDAKSAGAEDDIDL